jgi:hypothetical protein
MDNRKEGFAKAWNLWGEYDGKSADVAAKPTSKKVVTAISTTASAAVSLVATSVPTAVEKISNDPIGSAEQVVTTGNRVRGVARGSHELAASALSVASWPYVLAAVLLGGGLYWVVCHWAPAKIGSKP